MVELYILYQIKFIVIDYIYKYYSLFKMCIGIRVDFFF